MSLSHLSYKCKLRTLFLPIWRKTYLYSKVEEYKYHHSCLTNWINTYQCKYYTFMQFNHLLRIFYRVSKNQSYIYTKAERTLGCLLHAYGTCGIFLTVFIGFYVLSVLVTWHSIFFFTFSFKKRQLNSFYIWSHWDLKYLI